MAHTSINGILEKVQSRDKDFRYMAISDLQHELVKPGFRLDESSERKLSSAVLKQLEDVSGDISALAVKCLGLMVRVVSRQGVETLVNELSQKLVGGKKEPERDVASIGLKTVVSELPTSVDPKGVVARTTLTLVKGLEATEPDIVSNCLEVLIELITKYGSSIETEHGRIRSSMLLLLGDNRVGVKKRTIHCLGALATFMSDEMLSGTVDSILAKLQSRELRSADRQVYVQAISTVAHAADWRFGQFLGPAVPLVIQHCEKAGEGDDELQEACLQALETFTRCSPHEARQYVPTIFQHILKCLSYDPNYADEMEEDQEEALDEEDGFSDEGYSDDEDTSWKVRRAAARALSAIITQNAPLLPEIYSPASQALIARFREREENVKLDVFNTFVDLIRQVAAFSRRREAATGPSQQLAADVPAILRVVARQLRDKPAKTKGGLFQVLKELVSAQPAATASGIEQLVPGIVTALEDKSSSTSAIKIQALQFIGLALAGAEAKAWQPQIARLSPPVLAAISDRYYKVSAAALRVCEALVAAIRPAPQKAVQPTLKKLVVPLFEALQPKLAAQDQDQEVKEAAICCAGRAIAGLGDASEGMYLGQLKVLVERLRNDVTRLPAVKAITQIAQSPLQLPLEPHLQTLMPELISFLRKANRPLRQASLAAIEAVLMHKESACHVASQELVEALTVLVSDADLLLTAASLNVASTLLRCHPSSAASVSHKLLPPALSLVQSPLLQGNALGSLQSFFISMLQSRTPATSFESLLNALLAAGNSEDVVKAAQVNIAQCIAALCQSAGSGNVDATVHSLLAVLRDRTAQGPAQHLALLSIGEIGRSANLSAFTGLQQTLAGALASPSEELKTAASQALGAVCVGNLTTYLPFVLQQVQEQESNPKDQYLFLRALNELFMSLTASSEDAQPLPPNYQSEVLSLLLASCKGEEECRNVVAECLGHLSLLAPDRVVPVLQRQAGDGAVPTRAAVATAVRHAIVDRPHPVDALLAQNLPDFLALLSDPERHVRKAVIQLLSIAAHTKPHLVREQLPGLLPLLYAQTVIDEALIRTVDLGPFKHKIDDGLELRKAAFECMDILLETAPDRLFLPDFVKHLLSGIEDHYDVKMPCHLLLMKLAGKAGSHILASLDTLAKPLEKTLTTKLKKDAVKQEVDRNEDMLRSCLRAVDACAHIPNAETRPVFKQFLDTVVLQPPILPKYQAVREERAEAEGRPNFIAAS